MYQWMIAALVVGCTLLGYAIATQFGKESSRKRSIAVVDTQGICWLGTHGELIENGAKIHTNGGVVKFYYPAAVFAYNEHVSEKTVSRVLRMDVKYCTRLHKKD